MGAYKRTIHAVASDAATIALVRLIVREIKSLETSQCATDGNRRFVARVVDAASDDVRAQLKSEGTWI